MPGEFLVELPRNLARGFWTIAVPIWEAGVIAAEFTFDALRAHFNLIARFTAPIEQELLKNKLKAKPPTPSELNTLGQIALFPLIIVSWILAATAAPLIYNSVVLFLVGFVRTYNLSILDKPKSQLTLPEGEMPWYRLIFGIPGIILGASLGLVIAGIIVVLRGCYESFFSAVSLCMSAVNLASDPEDEFKESGLENETRKAHEVYGFGFLGLVVGIPFASLSYLFVGMLRMVSNSLENIKRVSAAAFNLVRPENDPLNFEPKEPFSNFRKYFLGFLGLVLGFSLAPLAIMAAAAERMALQGFERAKQIYADIIFQALSPSKQKKKAAAELLQEQPKVKQDSKWDRYFFSFPGIPVGVLTGVIGFLVVIAWRSLKNSWKTTKNLTFSGVNFVRHENDQKKKSMENDNRSVLRKYIFGFPGLVIGSLAALVAIGIETARRTYQESLKTGKTVSTAIAAKVPYFTEDEVTEKESPKPAETASEEGKRSLLDQAFFGGPGAVVGGIWGILLFSKGIAIHSLEQSYESLKHSVVLLTNLGLPKDDKIKAVDLLTDKRSNKQIYGFGLLGVIVGSLAGCITLFAAAFGWNSILTAKEIIVATLNAVREEQEEDSQSEKSSKPQSSHWAYKYVLGFPGIVFGSVGAFFVVITLGLKQIFKQSWETGSEIVKVMADEISPEEVEKIEGKKRTQFNRFVFGGLGILPGLIFGSLVFAYHFSKRTFNESLETAKRLFVSGMNLIRHEDEQILYGLEHDNQRRDINKYGFGFPGLLIGFVATIFVAIPLAILRRAVIESWKSGQGVFSAIVAESSKEESSSESNAPLPKARSNLDRFFFGGFGLLIGAVAGTIYKTIDESIYNAKIAFVKITVNTLNENEETEFLRLITIKDRQRSPSERYIWGFFGTLIGGIFGLTASTLIIIGKFISHNCKSWWALSGSFLNGSLSMPLFTGLGGDNRFTGEKVAGGLGYVLALATTLPISLVIFTFKKGLPVISALLLGITVSPIVALTKGISLAVEEPRFKNDKTIDKDPEDNLQPFKNIYSSLTIWGELPEGEKIAENQTGQKGVQSFVRKAVTLNTSTLDETILNQMLEAFKAWKGTPEEFFGNDGEYQRVLQETKKYYASTNCIQPNSTILEREKQIDEIGEFIKNYILGKQKQVPKNLYSNSKQSWSAIFWGAKPETTDKRIELDDFAAGKRAVSPALG